MVISVKNYWPHRSEKVRSKMRHRAELKWLRGWDFRIKALAVGSCTDEMALDPPLIYLPASAFQPYSAWSAVHFYVHFSKKEQEEKWCLCRQPCHQICMRKEYHWNEHLRFQHFCPTLKKGFLSFLYSSLPCFEIYPAILHISSLRFKRY